MPTLGTLTNTTRSMLLLDRVTWCASFGCKFSGLMFRRRIDPTEGLILAERRESRTGASIHMLFMNFPIAVVWLDSALRVVDTTLAKPWRLAYLPTEPAQYVLEAHPDLLNNVEPGDVLAFTPHNTDDAP